MGHDGLADLGLFGLRYDARGVVSRDHGQPEQRQQDRRGGDERGQAPAQTSRVGLAAADRFAHLGDGLDHYRVIDFQGLVGLLAGRVKRWYFTGIQRAHGGQRPVCKGFVILVRQHQRGGPERHHNLAPLGRRGRAPKPERLEPFVLL